MLDCEKEKVGVENAELAVKAQQEKAEVSILHVCVCVCVCWE